MLTDDSVQAEADRQSRVGTVPAITCRLWGSAEPVHAPERIAADRPDNVLVLPWNLRDELLDQLSCVRAWGGKLVFPIPEFEVVS